MRGVRRTGGFLITLLLNILLNFEYFIPAIILLILHFVLKLSMLWFWIALAVGSLFPLIWTILIFAAVNTDEPSTYKKQEVKVVLRDENEDIFKNVRHQ